MKPSYTTGIVVTLAFAAFLTGCSPQSPSLFFSLKNADTANQLKQFVAEKEMQARAATNSPPAELTAFFMAVDRGNWLAVSNAFSELSRLNQPGGNDHPQGKLGKAIESFFVQLREKLGLSSRPATYQVGFHGPAWEAAKEVYGACEAFGAGDETYAAAFGRDIIQFISPGSIYFGGTDPGRFIVTGMSQSHVKANPFYTLTQNALADGSYLDYLRGMYGDRLYIPTADDSRKCFEDYTQDVARRSGHDTDFPNEAKQLRPGEDVHVSGGRVQVSGQVAVMEINALLVKIIFDKNPKPDFFVEESFPLDWMYPQLEPHGLIFKLNRQPLAKLSDAILQNDHDYWAKYVTPMIGDWLNDSTPVSEVAAFAEKTFGRHDFSGFKGDPHFVENAYSHKMFSKLRSSIAGLYAWRVNHAADPEDRERMAHEADFAFRQAWALCPYSPEAVYRYVNFLLGQKRVAEAVVVAQTAEKLPEMQGQNGGQIHALVENLKQYQNRK